jgi:hypothetical protein
VVRTDSLSAAYETTSLLPLCVEAMIQPYRMCDDFLWKAKTFIGWSIDGGYHAVSMTQMALGVAE